MDPLITVLAALAGAAALGVAGAAIARLGPEYLAGAFRKPAQLGWPHGVQEEYLEERWGTSRAARALAAAAASEPAVEEIDVPATETLGVRRARGEIPRGT